MDFNTELSKRIYKQHCTGCAVATVVNLLWALTNYFVIEQGKWIYVSINLVAAILIGATLFICRRVRISGEILGLIPMLITLGAFAYTFNTIDLESFQKVVYMYVAAFIGAGMFLLWDRRFSIISSISAITFNGIFYVLFSPIPFDDYMLNGGLLVVTVAVFMVFSIDIRYKLIRKQLATQIALQNSEATLRKSEEDYRQLFEKNPIAMIILNEKSEVVQANEAFKIHSEQIHPDERVLKMQLPIQELKATMNSPQNEWKRRKIDGSMLTVSVETKEIDYKGCTSTLISLNDLTEIKSYQEELIQAREIAENAKEMQSQFLSNMSHEIRTPMNGIIGLTRVLLNTAQDEDQIRYLNAVNTSAENLMVIINDILDFSKIEAGKIQIEQTPFSLQENLHTIKELFKVKASEKGISMNVKTNGCPDSEIIGDPVRLNQILINLVGNAIKFTEHGGVELNVSSVGMTQDKELLRFEVRDSGIGIPTDKLDTIFDSFTQACMSTTRTHGGTGLGLTISKQLAELQGGRVWVESELGKGSCFYVEIPFSVVSEQSGNEIDLKERHRISEAKTLKEMGDIHILLVEDHPINQMLALKVLKDWGFTTDLAENGRIALEMVGKADYDLILMDISMPEMDGYQSTREIRSGKYSDNPGIPIVAMTASALIGENQKCFKAGMNDYISKPFKPEELLEKIHKHTYLNLKRA